MVRRRCALAGLAVAACGGGRGADDARPPADATRADAARIDAVPVTDAAVALCTPVAGTALAFDLVATAADADVVTLVTAPRGDRRAFVVERSGAIWLLVDGQLSTAPFLDLSAAAAGPVHEEGETGLLGLAFHPDYAHNGRFYVYYSTIDPGDGELHNAVAEYRASADPAVADPASGQVLLSIPKYGELNHNGGMIEFGADGLLYISVGDGGGNGDPQRTAQDKNRLLGKMLRIDVDHPGGGRPYGIPAGNPFAAGGGAPEVLMYGFRNPWRWSFDRVTGDLYIGDVGHHCVEEVDVIAGADAPGADFGWSDCEGTMNKYGTGCAAPAEPGRRAPVHEEVRTNATFGCAGPSTWNAVIGGQVYRGACYPDLYGRYFFADSRTGALVSFVYAGGQATDVVRHPEVFPGNKVASIHADATGELYMTDIVGRIFHLAVAPP